MSRTTIEWTDTTWNPVTGCTKVSPGCTHCYAETFAERFRNVPGHPFAQGFDLALRPERLDLPATWKDPRMIFVCSMSDLFHEDIPEDFIVRVFDTMRRTPRHTYQLLTKRAERLLTLSPSLPWTSHNPDPHDPTMVKGHPSYAKGGCRLDGAVLWERPMDPDG